MQRAALRAAADRPIRSLDRQRSVLTTRLMHEVAVICLCALVGHCLWRDAVEVFVARYSGADPPLKASTKLWILIRGAVGVAAIVAALATL